MDPLSAVSLAGTVVQSVTFACSLLKRSAEIYDSAAGSSNHLQSLRTVHGHLQAFSAKFASSGAVGADSIQPVTVLNPQGDPTLREICQASKAGCDRIAKVVEKLQVQDGPWRRLRSFRAALEIVWKRNEVEELDKRLQRTHVALTLHMCVVTSRFHEEHKADFARFKNTCNTNQIQHKEKIEQVFSMFAAMENRYSLPDRDLDLPLAPDRVRLNFEHRPMRHSRIEAAHCQTFDSIYRDGTNGQEAKCNLLSWLKAGDGIYWVSGKPGSGKSTFMKFVAGNEDTRRALDDWAAPKKALTASHYFWIAGTDMQKSQQGLLQELALKILTQCPDLIEPTCSERWGVLKSVKVPQPAWSKEELQLIMRRVAESDAAPKICLFMDGLDEYDGDHIELCENIIHLTRSGKVKVCASSRPWNVFTDAFGGKVSNVLRIHDLTEADIRMYAGSRLSEHPRWGYLNGQPVSGDRLINEITERTHGVFLWVFVVTKLLREGLSNDDSLADLLRRLETFPSDLEPFFKHMLDTVEPFYHNKMSGALQIVIVSGRPLRYPFFIYHDDEYDDKDYALKLKPKKVSIQELDLKRLYSRVSRRLDGQCKGLLEVNHNYVNFLHRTVSDFLQTRKMSEYLAAKSATGFNAKLSILRGSLAFVKDAYPTIMQRVPVEHPLGDGPVEINSQVKGALNCAEQIEDECPSLCDTVGDILDDLELSICRLNSSPGIAQLIVPQPGRSAGQAARGFFRASLIRFGPRGYLNRKLAQIPDYCDDSEGPPLAILVMPVTDKRMGYQSRQRNGLRDTLRVYWNMGRTRMRTIIMTASGKIGYDYMPHLNGEAFVSFLEYGADPNAKIYRSTTRGVMSFSTAWVDFLLLSFSMRPDWASESTYLQVLDAFLR
ncbi:Uu.00g032750.m01.CDS01 [Anthostomella pinea]|uniref:Uu.00g032750.m01.CDS01 n=1 Tax=Anthostomella pinea TaxID=933095 RepID=A0AAI8V983_9PEZI|nr:Uu.00g032750.m01.CDS01 [Anthostomella pinea]